MFEVATADQFPTFHAKIHWFPSTHTLPPVAGSHVLRQRVWLGNRHCDTLTAVESAGGPQLAAMCVFGDETEAGQDVELTFWTSGIQESLTQPGADLALEVGDHRVASGKFL